MHELKRLLPHLPVLVLSVHPEDQFAVRVLRAGGAGYLTKESAPQELVQAIKVILRGGNISHPKQLNCWHRTFSNTAITTNRSTVCCRIERIRYSV